MRGLLFVVFISFKLYGQTSFTISGGIYDASTGESLIGVSIFIPETGAGTISNEYGFYSLTLPLKDSVKVTYSYIGYASQAFTFRGFEHIRKDVFMGQGIALEEIVVMANSFEERKNSAEMSVTSLTSREISAIPMVLGESDALKAIQLKPGIPSGGEGTTGIFVRGGGADQNLFLLDEAVVYNANHLFGFFSTFNTDAIKDLKLYKGGFPAQYGGRLSSVLDVKMKDGNNQKFSGAGGLGIISSRLTLEGPIEKDKSSFLVSGRRTYFDIFTKAINNASENSNIPNYFFYDFNSKVNFKLGENDRLFFSGYLGKDDFAFSSDFFNFNFFWGNQTATARWNHVFGPKLFSNTTFTYSDYQYNISNQLTGFKFGLGSGIRDFNFKSDFFYNLRNNHQLKFGGGITDHRFSIGNLDGGSDDGVITFNAGSILDATEYGIYVSDEWSPNKKTLILGGLRLSGFAGLGADRIFPELRLSGKYDISSRIALKGSYAGMVQYIHLVRSSGVSLPTDIWYPSTKQIKPQTAKQWATGIQFIPKNGWMITAESYYKTFENLVEFVDGARLFVNDNLEDEFAIGVGHAKGFEFELEKNSGRLTGWIGYTLAFVRRGNFSPVNLEKSFDQIGFFSPSFDRRHDVSVVLFYKLNRRLDLSATWVYGSGDLIWMPPGRFSFQDVAGINGQVVIPHYLDRNNFRLPPYHRLDLGLNLKFFPTWGESSLSFSVVNAYDRRNTFFIFLEPKLREIGTPPFSFPERIAARQVSLFPIIPAITWNFKF
jgi:hypothetical protein